MKITFEGTIEELMKLFGGIEEEKKETEKDNSLKDISEYARVFDIACRGWTNDPEKNMFFIKQVQEYTNVRLQNEGYLFLNDVYDMLGLPRTRAGQCVGWVYDEKNPIGDNYIDFGIYNFDKNKEFINGYTPNALLDFNIDGCIIDKI